MKRNSKIRVVIIALFLILCKPLLLAQENHHKQILENGQEAFQNFYFEKVIELLSPLESTVENFDEEYKFLTSYLLGASYHNVGNLSKSKEMYEIALNTIPPNEEAFLFVKQDLLSVYIELGELDAAAEIVNDNLGLFNNKDFQQSKYYLEFAVTLCSYYYDAKEYDKVIEIAQKGLSSVDAEDNSEQIIGHIKNTLYNNLGNANRAKGKYEQAAVDYKMALCYISYTNQDISDAKSSIGVVYVADNQPDSALAYLEEAESLYQQRNAPIDKQRVKNSYYLGFELMNRGESLRARRYLNDAENGFEYLGDSIHLLDVYSMLYYNSMDIGEKELTIKYANLVKDYVKQSKGNINNSLCYSTYAEIVSSEGNQEEAISIMKEIIKNDSIGSDAPIDWVSSSFYNLAVELYKNNEFVPAEVAIKKALELTESYKEKNQRRYIECQIILTQILIKLNRIGEAISNLENIQELVDAISGWDETKSRYYYTLSYLYSNVGNLDKYLEYRILYSETQLKNKGPQSNSYARSLIELSDAYALSKQKEKAEECFNTASQILKQYGEETNDYYYIIHKQALKHAFDSIRRKEGDRAFSRCLSMSKKLMGENSIEHAEDLCWYGIYLLNSSKDKQGITLIQTGLNILTSFKGYGEYILFFLGQQSVWCHYLNDYELAYGIDRTYYRELKDYLSENLLKLVDWQREALWASAKSGLTGLITAASVTDSPKYLKLAYNSLLLGKGLLLQSSNHITNVIKQSEDKELIDIHNRIQIEKNRLLNASDKDEIEAIRLNIYSLQRKELNRLDQLEAALDMFDIEWTDVRDNLEEGEVAIEFVSFPTQDCNSYAALVLNKHLPEPLLIPLFNDKELERYVQDENTIYDYEDPDFYRFIWERLEPYAIKDAKNVYFAPDGVLHKIAIESLVDNNGRCASDKWNLFRLTSTREIVSGRTNNTYQDAALYGGLKYTMKSEKLEEAAKLRAGVKYLAETRYEIEEIEEMLEAHSIQCKVKTGETGTEESFLSLSSTGVNIIHLATHGFFWTDKNQDDYSNVRFKSLIENSDFGESALLRSGLMFSGANLALQGENLPMGIEDGILTAHEISSLDFDDLDLVVLSACQTAQGEISGEGVFGLQRGFKLAGAHSLLMSLWNVNDYSTRLLMTDFYKHLLQGESKREALKNAQKTVRNTSGFELPEYWAGFILLDGL